MEYLYLIVLAFFQNVAFTLVSRARNRDNFTYHAVMAVFSNGIFYLTFKLLLVNEMGLDMLPFYLVGTVTGSLFGAKLALKIEEAIGALADPFTKT